jgi:glycine dehydrogenase subunit 1
VQFAPHTSDDLEAMLAAVGVSSLDALFEHIPAALRPDRTLDLPDGRSEDEVLRIAAGFAAANEVDAVCFAGGGAYDHFVPAVVGAMISRGELLTAYTPYQPEVSQGMLQALFEYQTVIAELTGLPVSNASLYDGGSAVAEAVSMACAATRRNRVLLAAGLDAPSRTIVRTYGDPVGRVVDLAGLAPDGRSVVDAVDDDVAAVVIQQPNALGVVEDVRAQAEAAHAAGAQLIVKWDPLAAGILATPGSQGADLVVGEGQSLGQGLQYGGPSFGFLACTDAQVRRIPGRIVGATVDHRGTPGYVMTLRAREQDIRREKATSNICTNQTLCAVAGLVYLTWLGPQGLVELARACLARAHHAAARLTAIDGVTLAADGPFVKEFAIRAADLDPDRVVAELHDAGYLVGPVLGPDMGPFAGAIVVAVTERRTAAEVEGLADALETIMKAAA